MPQLESDLQTLGLNVLPTSTKQLAAVVLERWQIPQQWTWDLTHSYQRVFAACRAIQTES